MLLHPTHNAQTTLTKVRSGDAQPNAVDIRLDRIWKFTDDAKFEITDEYKNHAEREEVFPDSDGFFLLAPGTYEICFENMVDVSEGEAGWVITRSTLNRNGAFITSGLYDSGYSGPMAGALHISIPTKIRQGTRVGQYLIVKAETGVLYDGDYGKGSDHDRHLTE